MSEIPIALYELESPAEDYEKVIEGKYGVDLNEHITTENEMTYFLQDTDQPTKTVDTHEEYGNLTVQSETLDEFLTFTEIYVPKLQVPVYVHGLAEMDLQLNGPTVRYLLLTGCRDNSIDTDLGLDLVRATSNEYAKDLCRKSGYSPDSISLD